MSKAASDMTTYYHHYRGEAMSAQQPPVTTDRVRMFYSTAVAWDASDEPPIPNFRESSGAEFDRWLAAHDAEREAQVRTQVAADVANYVDATIDIIDTQNGARLAFEVVDDIISGRRP